MPKPADLTERLVDFDHCGNSATERYTLRMEAWDEIRRLRRALERVRKDQDAAHKKRDHANAQLRFYQSTAASLKRQVEEWIDKATERTAERDTARRALERVRSADNMSCVWHIVEGAILRS